ncbi:MAG: FecR domain-containing protein [Bacteroidales bacterium]|nr:FecR domain-containing protein [Bacteroidales bacterium]
MEPIRIAHLIAKQITGNLTLAEERELNKWLESESHLELYHSLHDKKKLEMRLQAYQAIDTAKAKEKYLKRVAPVRSLKLQLLRIAAIALLVLSVGSVIYILRQSQADHTSGQQLAVVEPGQSKATLTLEDGQVVELDNNESLTVKQKGAIINNEAGKINYEVTNENVLSLKYNTLQVPRGGEYQVTLPDGTRVWVNSETQLKYPVKFAGDTRTIELSGEAYFEVAHNAKQPFIVKTKSHNIEVLGTTFNIRAYDDDIVQHTTLVEGSVQASYFNTKGTKNTQILKPEQQIQFNQDDKQAKLTTVDTYIYTAWKQGRFVFRDQSIESILNGMSRWYDIEIEFENQSVADKTFSLDIKRDAPFEKIITVLELTRSVEISTVGNRIIVKEVSE